MPNAPRPFILASGSPRRSELLSAAGFDFEVVPADIDESSHPDGLLPAELAVHLAGKKADAVAARHPGRVVLGADTVVAFGDRAIGKPADAEDARRLLSLLAGTTHVVVTGVAVRRVAPPDDPGVPAHATDDHVMTAVHLRALDPTEVNAYILSGQWQGKAGGYGLQDEEGKPDPFVTRQSGCRTNVVGLPMTTAARMLADAGVAPGVPPRVAPTSTTSTTSTPGDAAGEVG